MNSLLNRATNVLVLTILCCAPIGLYASCKATAVMSEEQQATYAELTAERDAALAAGDEATAVLKEAELAALEETAVDGFTEGVTGMFGAYLPAPVLKFMGASALIKLAFPHSRRKYVRALKQVSPFDGESSPWLAFKTLVATTGAIAATPESKASALGPVDGTRDETPPNMNPTAAA